MKEFTLDDLVDMVHEDLKLEGPKKLTRKILRKHFDYILKVMKSKRNRMLLFECDMVMMYTNPDIFEMMGKVADLDETAIPKFENGFGIAGKGFWNRRKNQRIGASQADSAVDFLPKLNA